MSEHHGSKDEEFKKPWRSEYIVAAVNGRYVGKIIALKGGQSVSPQRHRLKTETITVLSGLGTAEIGPTVESFEVIDLAPGDGIHIPADGPQISQLPA